MSFSADVVPDRQRAAGWEHEVSFWKDWISADGVNLSPRARAWCEASPNHELEPEINLFLRGAALSINIQQKRPMQLLDIGSGPISILSRSFDDLKVEMQAADPLGGDYQALWPRNCIHKAKVCTPAPVAGEELAARFGDAKFDVAHIRNAIDHAVHPMKVIEQMIAVTRRGGFIVIHGFENEAITENWHGFHQWNMQVIPGGIEFVGKSGAAHRPVETFASKLKTLQAWNKPIQGQPGRNWALFVAAVL